MEMIGVCLLLLLGTVRPALADARSSCSADFLDGHHHLSSSAVHVAVHHRYGPCLSPLPPPASIAFSAVLRRDETRTRWLAARLAKSAVNTAYSIRSQAISGKVAGKVPLKSGKALGVGNYVAKIGLGTPAKDQIMVVDTGSSLTWIQCSPCKKFCHPQSGSVFNPNSSATYRPVRCSATECRQLRSATLNPSGCSRPTNTCIYEAGYGDGSLSVGYLSRETLTLRSIRQKGFIFGCGQDNEGIFGRTAGLVGLGRNSLSLLSQLAPRLGSSFSYCLPRANGTGYLSIGAPGDPSKFAYTPMLTDAADDSLYFLRLTGITVGGRVLPVPASTFAKTPTVIDSGTVVTRLNAAAYAELSKAVAAALERRQLKRAAPYSILDTCFEGKAMNIEAPKVRLVFAGGAEVQLPAGNVMIDVDGGRTACLAFASSSRIAIIGNQQQQTLSVVYDVRKARIGFAAGGCG